MRKIETRRIITKLMLIALLVTMSVYSTAPAKAQDCRGACLQAYAQCQFNCRGLPSGTEQTVCLAVCAVTNTVCLAQCGL
jgi:hypothetical protein